MTDEMKLLRAFIEAQGFDVEEIQEETLIGNCFGKDIHGLEAIDYKVTKRKPIKRLDVPLCKKPVDKAQDMVTMCEILIKHNMTCLDFVMEVGGKV